ncbi:Sperm flagellar protein 1 [Cichlidogyrus casuarinus]|uniref:Sperm flagellar protein 1 n=1 Tax=Cichlidogyrus casuarinus TaxID=1844966 RepID=A0ABD2QFF8_9PLAT
MLQAHVLKVVEVDSGLWNLLGAELRLLDEINMSESVLLTITDQIMADIEDAVLQDLYSWVDKIPLSRPKRNISRDFSDGVMMAELIKHFFPKLVDLHNFPVCNSHDLKKKNWFLLNWKVFKKLNFELSDDVIENLSNAKPGVVEKVLLLLRTKMDRLVYQERQKNYDFNSDEEQIPARPLNGHSGNGYDQETAKKTTSLQNIKNSSITPPIPNKQKLTRKNRLQGNRQTQMTSSKNQPQMEDYVARMTYEEKVQECLALEEMIEILNAKVRRLEHLISLKDVRIDDLQNRLTSQTRK